MREVDPVKGSDQTLFDLGFLELDMLLCDGVIFAHGQLVGHGAGVLFSNIKETRICC